MNRKELLTLVNAKIDQLNAHLALNGVPTINKLSMKHFYNHIERVFYLCADYEYAILNAALYNPTVEIN